MNRQTPKQLITWTICLFVLLVTFLPAEILPVYGGIYSEPVHYFPGTLDPVQISKPVDMKIGSLLYDSLVRLDAQQIIQPALAESWSVTTDNLVYTFNLRPEVYFHDGTLCDASSVQFSLERLALRSNHSPKSWILDAVAGYKDFAIGQSEHLSGITILDPVTVQMTLTRPVPGFLIHLSLMAASIIPVSFNPAKPVGTGSFVWSENQVKGKVTLLTNAQYWQGRAMIDSLEFPIIPENENSLLEFELGKLSAAQVPETEFRRLNSDDRWKGLLVKQPGSFMAYIGCNLTKSPVNNIKFRTALMYSVNRNDLCKMILNGHARMIDRYAVFSDISSFQEGSIVDNLYSPDSAMMLGQGFNAFTVKLLIPSESISLKNIAQRIQWNAQSAGIKLALQELNYPAYYQAIKTGQFEMYIGSYTPELLSPELNYREFITETNTGATGNASYFYNAEVNTLLDKLSGTENQDEQETVSGQIEKHLLSSLPYLPLFIADSYYIHRPNLMNYDLTSTVPDRYRSIWFSHSE